MAELPLEQCAGSRSAAGARATEAAPRAHNAAPALRTERSHPEPPGRIPGAWQQPRSIRESVRRGRGSTGGAGPGRGGGPREIAPPRWPGRVRSTVHAQRCAVEPALRWSRRCSAEGEKGLAAARPHAGPGPYCAAGQYAGPSHSAVLFARTDLREQDCADRREEQTSAVRLELAVRCTESTAWAGVAGRHGAPACPQA